MARMGGSCADFARFARMGTWSCCVRISAASNSRFPFTAAESSGSMMASSRAIGEKSAGSRAFAVGRRTVTSTVLNRRVLQGCRRSIRRQLPFLAKAFASCCAWTTGPRWGGALEARCREPMNTMPPNHVNRREFAQTTVLAGLTLAAGAVDGQPPIPGNRQARVERKAARQFSGRQPGVAAVGDQVIRRCGLARSTPIPCDCLPS